MRPPVASHRALPLRDLGTLVRVQYPDRPDLALIAALRLLASSGAAASGVQAAYARGALLTRRTRNALGAASHAPLSREQAPHDSGMLLIGEDTPVLLIVGDDSLLDIQSSYRLGELDLPPRLLCGDTHMSPTRPDHTLADFPFGLTGVYLVHRVDTPLAAAYRLMTQLGPLTRRRLDFDLQHLEPSWRQLRDTA